MGLTWLGTFANAIIPSPASGPATGRPRPWRRTASALAVLALAAIAATALPAATADAQTAPELVGNINQARVSLGGSFANETAQAFTTGSNAGGYRRLRAGPREHPAQG